MTQPIISDQWAQWVLPIVRKTWFQEMTAAPSPSLGLFGVESSTSSVEYSQGMGDFDEVPEYNSADAEGAPGGIAYDNFNELYEKTFTHKEYAKGVVIERKLWDDDRSGMIRRRAAGLGNAFGRTIARHAASVFNNAFSSSYVGADAVALCSDSHPYSPANADTYDNKGTTAFSYNAVVSTLQAGKNMLNDRGLEMPIFYDTLLVPIELEAAAYEITAAINKPTGGAAQNEANFVGSQGLRTIVDPYLNDSNNWFMLDSRQTSMHLLWFWRVRPELALRPTSEYDLEAKYRGYMRYSFGWDDPRFVYGHEVTGGSP